MMNHFVKPQEQHQKAVVKVSVTPRDSASERYLSRDELQEREISISFHQDDELSSN